MVRYSLEHREWVLRQMMPPINRTVADIAEDTGINPVTLYAWRKQAKTAGAVVLGNDKQSDAWSSADKFRVVVEASMLSKKELAGYCRRKGLYVEQVHAGERPASRSMPLSRCRLELVVSSLKSLTNASSSWSAKIRPWRGWQRHERLNAVGVHAELRRGAVVQPNAGQL